MKFNKFNDRDLQIAGNNYFDILTDKMINPSTYAIDLGCGSGRWSKFLLDRIGFIEVLDPSDAVFAADKLIGESDKVRLIKASIDNIPFPDETFDFAMSVGVLHHIPDTVSAMKKCVEKIKKGGYFYAYLYYDLEDRGQLFKVAFHLSTLLRKIVSSLPSGLKKIVCDVLAALIYFPLSRIAGLLTKLNLEKLGRRLPLSAYQDKTFHILRNDALDRFGTKLEQRFSRKEILEMMTDCGLTNLQIASGKPFYHAVGQKL